MNHSSNDSHLLARAIEGDHDALATLLLANYDKLASYLNGKIPLQLRSIISAEDIIQETHVQAFRKIATFKPQGDDAFDRWIITIAKRRLLDKINAYRTRKPEGELHRARSPAGSSSIATLLAVVAQDSHTPSRSVDRREQLRALQVGLAGLADDYRQALTLRYIESRPVAEIAKRQELTTAINEPARSTAQMFTCPELRGGGTLVTCCRR